MNLQKICNSFLLMIFFFSSLITAGDMKKGETYQGFKLVEKRFVKEVNSECYYFEHVKSGARLFKIASDDPNKTFAIAFKTDPESDCGTPHIMEHSVLNGSKKFPVKSPFDVLMKGSLLTFINAFTGDDLTCFPIASKNDKDYFNLMHVYLDAVFQPLFIKDKRILMQEGWHHEMEKADGPIIYKGVVYNEMKGAYSDPNRELNYQIFKNLFPENGYRFTSGGYPSAIPKLTQEAFIKYHDKYYHPVNSYILLYGNADLEKELAFINKEYLSKYNSATRPTTFPLQKAFASMKEITVPYAVTEGTNTENQSYLSFNVVIGLNTDRALVMGLNTLCDVLVNQEAAPIRIALQKAGIGKEVNASVDEKQQNVLQIIVQNANPQDKEKFKKIVLDAFKEAAEKGVDKKAVEGSLSRAEFALREGNDAQKGLNYTFQILPGWFFADDPFLTLEYEKPLAKVKTALTSDYLERIIKEQILGNSHSLILVLEPKPEYDKELSAKTDKELLDYNASLQLKEKESLVNETMELIKYQKKEDTPEALATIPLLERKDINPKAEWYPINEKKVKDVTVLNYEEFVNNVVYARFLFDVRVLPQELIPYASLLTEVLGNQNTENYTYGDLDNALNINTGGFNSFLNTYTENLKDENLIPKFIVNTKAMNTKIDKTFELVSEILNKTRYADNDRLKAIITRYQSRLDAQVKQNGYGYAQTRTMSYFSNVGMFNELTGGINYYWFITDLAKNYDQKAGEIKDKLIKTASLLFNRKNLTTAVTCSKQDYSAYASSLEKLLSTLPEKKAELVKWNFNFEKKNEGFTTASKVQYVIKGFDLKKLGYEWTGKLRVLSQILSTDWLQNRVRVIGGAYGGFSKITEQGFVLFNSYRDPNLKETLDNYDAIPEYLSKLELDDKSMTRYILGTIAGMDTPLTSSQKGNTGVSNYFNKVKLEDVQRDRDAVINATLADVKSLKQLIVDGLAQKAYCVYGNEGKINSQKDLFGKVEALIR